MEKLGFVSSTGKELSPRLKCFFVQDAEEQKDEESLERIEDSEQDLKGLPKSNDREGEDSKEPGESKEEHHSTDADHQTYDGFVADCFLLSSSCAPSVTNQHHNHPDEDDSVEKKHSNDWAKECTPKGSRMRQKTAV